MLQAVAEAIMLQGIVIPMVERIIQKTLLTVDAKEHAKPMMSVRADRNKPSRDK